MSLRRRVPGGRVGISSRTQRRELFLLLPVSSLIYFSSLSARLLMASCLAAWPMSCSCTETAGWPVGGLVNSGKKVSQCFWKITYLSCYLFVTLQCYLQRKVMCSEDFACSRSLSLSNRNDGHNIPFTALSYQQLNNYYQAYRNTKHKNKRVLSLSYIFCSQQINTEHCYSSKTSVF